MKDRIRWIDIARGIGISFIVLGHSPVPRLMEWWLFSFHVPLFFILSGMTISPDRYSWKDFLRRKAYTLLVPYAVFWVLTFVFYAFVTRPIYLSNGIDIPISGLIMGFFYGIGKPEYMIHDIPLWFLPCLFLAEVIYYGLHRVGKRSRSAAYAGYAMLFVLGPLLYLLPFRPPWSADSALVGAVLIMIGSRLRDLYVSRRRAISLLLVAVPFSVLALYNGRIDMASGFYGNPLLFYMGAVSGSLVVISLAYLLRESGWLEALGRQAIAILGLHMPFIVSFYILYSPALTALHIGLSPGDIPTWPLSFSFALIMSVMSASLLRHSPLGRYVFGKAVA